MPEFRGPLFGVVPILLTPFDAEGSIDESSLRNEVDFVLDAGAHGIGIALGSEVFTFTEAERDFVTRIVVEQTRDQVPVVINTGAISTNLAVFYSQMAQAAGASALMCTPPAGGFPASEIVAYYQAISDAATLPIVIQDTPANPVAASTMRMIGEQCEHVVYAKVENTPTAVYVHHAVQEAGDVLEVFGGAGGAQLLPELRRGSIGTMPFPTTVHAFVEVWNRWQAGDIAGAQSVFDQKIRPLLDIQAGALGGVLRIHKDVFCRQGIIRSGFVRPPAELMDEVNRADLDMALAQMGL